MKTIEIDDKTKYVLDEFEHNTLYTIDKAIQQAEQHLTHLRKQKIHLNAILMDQVDKNETYYEGEHWDCMYSPFNHCIYKLDGGGEMVCAFCGQPEERK